MAERKNRRHAFADPLPGGTLRIGMDDVAPGEWVADARGLPPGCPVEPLGMDGDVLYLMDALGQLASVQPSPFGATFIQRLFGERQDYLLWAFPRFNKENKHSGWAPEAVKKCFYTAAARRGLFSPVDRVRGRGAWQTRQGDLVYNSGDCLWHTGRRGKRGDYEPIDTGFHDDILYARRPAVVSPWTETISRADNPSRDIILQLRRWNWERPDVDPVLFLGWLGAAMLGGALPWRPTCFIVGDKATGKSTLQALVRTVLGDALIQSADTSAAGIYQRVQQDALPIAVDELEAEADNRKVMAVVKLARLAASGAMMLRGGADHTGTEFRAQSTFLFSSINPPPLLPQDVSRMAILRLRALTGEQTSSPAPDLQADTVGPMLLRQLMDNWTRFPKALECYRAVLREGGHDGRGQDTFGVLLALADLALGPEIADELRIPMCDNQGIWADWLRTTSMLEYEDASSNWKGCLVHLLTSRVEAWRGGGRHTVGALLDELRESWNSEDDKTRLSEARKLLAQAGLGLMIPREIDNGWVLAVPNESQLVMSLFRETQWAGAPGASVWKSALRQAPASIVCTDASVNRVRINGVQTRCTLVRLNAFDEMGREG